MKFNFKKWRHEKKLTLFFTLLTLFTIFIVLFTTYALFNHYVLYLLRQNDKNVTTFNDSMSDILYLTYVGDVKDGDIKNYNNIIQNLYSHGVLKYAYIINNSTKKIEWTFDNKIINSNLKGDELNQVLLELQLGDDVNEISKPLNQSSSINFAYSVGGRDSTEDGLMKIQIFLSFILFVLFALASSMYLGRILKKPLDHLTRGIKEFGSGNLKFRMKQTPFIELNQIVDSYNKMASELDTLYNNLEAKVNERTTALERANKELKETQSIMVHSEKMRSLGELVAGIAHEINNPINFIYGNMIHFDNYVNDIFTLFDKYETLKEKLQPSDLKDVEEFKNEIDIDFIRTDIKDIITSCKDGADRAKNIIADLKNFSRLDETTISEFDIPKEINTTLNILYNKYKNKIEIVKNYADDLPKIEAYGRQLNQVFMNILDNAIYAIKDAGTITINAYKSEYNTVSIEFIDNGIGIKQEDLNKVFEPFYTTKPVGSGTGLGMSIAYKVISSHRGKVEVESQINIGTKFKITLPVNQIKGENNEV